jgi:hypothetical protein
MCNTFYHFGTVLCTLEAFLSDTYLFCQALCCLWGEVNLILLRTPKNDTGDMADTEDWSHFDEASP